MILVVGDVDVLFGCWWVVFLVVLCVCDEVGDEGE